MQSILALALILGGTTIVLQDTTEPGAVAEIEMNNLAVNGDGDNGDYVLTLRDMQVWVHFTWNSGLAGADSITAFPPEGMICRPSSCVLELLEDYSGKLYLIPWEGM